MNFANGPGYLGWRMTSDVNIGKAKVRRAELKAIAAKRKAAFGALADKYRHLIGTDAFDVPPSMTDEAIESANPPQVESRMLIAAAVDLARIGRNGFLRDKVKSLW